MRPRNAARLVPFVLAAACTGGDTDSDTDSDTTVPLPVGVQWFDEVRPVDVTPDGHTVLVQVTTSIEGEVRLLDTASGAMTFATTLGDAGKNMATGLSADLAVSALHAVPVEAGVWRESTDWVDLASPFTGCDQDNGGAFDVSDDGSVVVGLMWDGCAPLAFRAASGDVQILETLGEPFDGSPTHATNRATVVSGDGQISAGFASNGVLDRTPARWTADGQGVLLDPTNQDAPGEVVSISADGRVLGVMRGADGAAWTEAGGFVDLGRPDTAMPADPVYPNAMTADGAAIFGAVGSDFFTVPVAFVWTATDGSRALQPLVEAAGIDVPEGWVLTNVLSVSDDGTTLAGLAYDADFAPKMFVLTVPATTFGR